MAKPSKLPAWDTTEVNSVEPDSTHQDEGWLAPGGVPEKPPFQTFNHWMNAAWKWLKEFNKQGIVEWDAVTVYDTDDISKGSDGDLYKSLTNTNSNKNPISEPTFWEPMPTKAAVDAKVAKAGDSMTGALSVSVATDTAYIAKNTVASGTSSFIHRDSANNSRLFHRYDDSTGVGQFILLNGVGAEVNRVIIGTDGNMTVSGAAPTSANHLTRKDYVDALAIGGTLQAWTVGGRALDTVYTNTEGHPIEVLISIGHNSASTRVDFAVAGAIIARTTSDGSKVHGYSFIVPAGATYEARNISGTPVINIWSEFK